jgi:four helix bundle protein
LNQRTKEFALRIIKLTKYLPKTIDGQIIAKQILHSGTSVGANYRAVCRARSRNEFITKLGIVIEETDETMFWLEIIVETKMMKKELVESLLNEANEITAIMVSSANSASKKNSKI